MLYRENGRYKLMKWVASFIQNGEEVEKYVITKEELYPFKELGHITDLSFDKAVYDDITKERLEEVRDFSEDVFIPVEEYVMEGILSKELRLETIKRMDTLEESIIELIMLTSL